MKNEASLFPADQLTLQTEDGRTVILEVVSITPSAPETELISVVFAALTPREALAEHDYGAQKQYTYAAPKDWELRLGDHIRPAKSGDTATVVGFPQSYTNKRWPLKTLTKRF